MTPEFRPLVKLSGVARPVRHSIWEEIVTVAIFKPLKKFEDALRDGEVVVWGKLVQVVVAAEEVEKHLADGWHKDAATALDAAHLADVEQENASLQAQIDETKKKLDGRSKEARALKADAS